MWHGRRARTDSYQLLPVRTTLRTSKSYAQRDARTGLHSCRKGAALLEQLSQAVATPRSRDEAPSVETPQFERLETVGTQVPTCAP